MSPTIFVLTPFFHVPDVGFEQKWFHLSKNLLTFKIMPKDFVYKFSEIWKNNFKKKEKTQRCFKLFIISFNELCHFNSINLKKIVHQKLILPPGAQITTRIFHCIY